jgi:small GTP-binding protein
LIARIRGELIKIALVGPEQAGKTAMFIRLKGGEFREDLKPTISLSRDNMMIQGLVRASVFDLGGQEKLRDQWKKVIRSAHLVIYVIDMKAKEKIDSTLEIFKESVLPAIEDQLCIACGNKIDLLIKTDGRNSEQVITRVEQQLNEKFGGYCQKVFATSMKSNRGINEITNWLFNKIIKSKEIAEKETR